MGDTLLASGGADPVETAGNPVRDKELLANSEGYPAPDGEYFVNYWVYPAPGGGRPANSGSDSVKSEDGAVISSSVFANNLINCDLYTYSRTGILPVHLYYINM